MSEVKSLDLKIKLCGFKDKELVDFACQFDIHFIGFVFYDGSVRNVDINNIAQIAQDIPNHIKKVAVLVDASDSKISQIITQLKPDFLQLHGGETLKRCQEIKEKFRIPIIKAFHIGHKEDLHKIVGFEDVAKYFLFDTKSTTEIIGSITLKKISDNLVIVFSIFSCMESCLKFSPVASPRISNCSLDKSPLFARAISFSLLT